MKGLIWFRADLRVRDNTALWYAAQACDEGLLAVFYLTPKTWQQHGLGGNKITFMLQQLAVLKTALSRLNIHLLVETVPGFKQSKQAISELMESRGFDALYFNKQYELDEWSRDSAIYETLTAQDKKVFVFDDQLVVPPGAILTGKKQPYTVFTPFSKTWHMHIDGQGGVMAGGLPKKQVKAIGTPTGVPAQIEGFKPSIDMQQWQAGEDYALSRLQAFVADAIQDYTIDRDFPELDGTSHLSPYLAAGVISPRQCYAAAKAGKRKSKGQSTWINELVWRDFYKHVIYHFPHVCKGQSFKPAYDKLKWDNNAEMLEAWQQGQTGFPMIDAAMRQLNQTGWMHNRLRMNVAMFLSKLMNTDWRLGEAYFNQQLVDSDFAANNGGWQWSASTGTDAAPYFRIFNPYSQSEKFDPKGEFIRQYCPELKDLDSKAIHKPNIPGYPEPILDYKKSREAAIKKFKNLK